MMKAFIGFAGFGGPEIALREAGFEIISIEKDSAIAEVNRRNGGNVLTANILGVDPFVYIGYTLMHFSPPCPFASVARNSKAKQNIYSRISDLAYHQSLVNGESEFDIRFARKICQFIRIGRPKYFTLENVGGYRKSRSWLLIWYTLLDEGYGVDAWNLNAADYGVPQSRRRMIVIACRDGRKPAKPFPTHAKKPDMFTKPWVGWYETIKDLIPELPDTQFAPWQLDRLPDEMKTYLVMTANTNRNGVDNKSGRGCLEIDQPANTVNTFSNGNLPRAILIPGDNTSNGTVRDADEPMVTVQTRALSRCPHRAFILGQGERSELKSSHMPADTVTANGNQTGVKAVIMGGQKGLLRENNSPIWTIFASDKLDTRIQETTDRIVSMTVRCLARYQDFPDKFILPGEPGLIGNLALLAGPLSDRELACRGIGNALPPGLYRAVLGSLRLL